MKGCFRSPTSCRESTAFFPPPSSFSFLFSLPIPFPEIELVVDSCPGAVSPRASLLGDFVPWEWLLLEHKLKCYPAARSLSICSQGPGLISSGRKNHWTVAHTGIWVQSHPHFCDRHQRCLTVKHLSLLMPIQRQVENRLRSNYWTVWVPVLLSAAFRLTHSRIM